MGAIKTGATRKTQNLWRCYAKEPTGTLSAGEYHRTLGWSKVLEITGRTGWSSNGGRGLSAGTRSDGTERNPDAGRRTAPIR